MKANPRAILSGVSVAVLCLLIAASDSAFAQSSSDPQVPRTLAVIIGISRYPKLPGGQQLQFAERDAVLFAEALRKVGISPSRFSLLTGADATVSGIKSAIGSWLARSTSEADTVIIFFSGHGVFETEFGESYLLGYDSDPKDLYATGLSITELGNAISKRIKARRLLIVADAVRRDFFDPDHDGAANARWFFQAVNQIIETRPGAGALLANSPGEFSREGQRWSAHGVFTKHLADAMAASSDANSDGVVTADELFSYVSSHVAADTSGKQHPWRSDVGLAQIVVAPAARPSTEIAAVTAPESRKTESAPRTPVVEQSAPPVEPEPTKPSTKPAETASSSRPSNKPPLGKKSEAKPQAENKSRPATSPSSTRPAPEQPAPPPTPPIVATDTSSRPETAGARDEAASAKPAPEVSIEKAPKPRAAEPKTNPPAPPKTKPVGTTQPAGTRVTTSTAEIATEALPPAPKPTIDPPNVAAVGSERASANQPGNVGATLPMDRSVGAPSPLPLQLEAALAANMLVEPKGTSAWDIYQRMVSDPKAQADVARLKPRLLEAMIASGKEIALGDLRADNVSDKTDEIRRAGQLFARARTLAPAEPEVTTLEKLTAAQGLLALQFYDEAERSLSQLSGTKIAAVENSLGLVYQGKLDSFRAERAFKRAIALEPRWAAPHYNLAMLYRSQQNEAAVAELEAAASIDSNNVATVAALGDEYFERGKWQQAADAFKKAIELKPSDDNLHTKLGHALFSMGQKDAADREYQKARELRGRP